MHFIQNHSLKGEAVETQVWHPRCLPDGERGNVYHVPCIEHIEQHGSGEVAQCNLSGLSDRTNRPREEHADVAGHQHEEEEVSPVVAAAAQSSHWVHHRTEHNAIDHLHWYLRSNHRDPVGQGAISFRSALSVEHQPIVDEIGDVIQMPHTHEHDTEVQQRQSISVALIFTVGTTVQLIEDRSIKNTNNGFSTIKNYNDSEKICKYFNSNEQS